MNAVLISRATVLAAATIGLIGLVTAYVARAITTPAIVQSAISPECLEYEVIGLCAWLDCSTTGCSVKTSIRVKHFIPELVVSAYENTGENPWTEIALLSPPLGNALGGGSTNEAEPHEHANTRFKNVDAIGHPSELFYRFTDRFGWFCESDAVPFKPYFLSTLDALAWRSGIPEMAYPEALTFGIRELGVPGDLWSPVYPRSGFVSQTHDYKVAAATAQRAADIVTRRGQPHVYQPLAPEDDSDSGRWPPAAVMEGDPETHKWQRLEPEMTMACSIFPDGGENNRLQPPGDYVWSLWRPYRCCKKRGQELLTFTGE
ncbi:TIGR03756 family integrating conjugative element protein [Pistricoccus aurantiacus]|uniref:TIGR03756 family integrating conjugative element protein n=1 Tax=Pistricoccus aurantiacus TaxID=1883414 RepID=A0A5B8SXS4_9GAMM|nr:TIGR03756 family integrating conjugative element protein [Pistricoccus aurantiacus]QEA39628.1 TIGR03756 family integrating conjugative element protein [Pistricoccus aurantiacus]